MHPQLARSFPIFLPALASELAEFLQLVWALVLVWFTSSSFQWTCYLFSILSTGRQLQPKILNQVSGRFLHIGREPEVLSTKKYMPPLDETVTR